MKAFRHAVRPALLWALLLATPLLPVGRAALAQAAYAANPVTLPSGGGFSHPFHITVDASGNVFVADSANNAVKEIPYSNGNYGAPITLATGFFGPEGVAVDTTGNVFVADSASNTVKEIHYANGSYSAPVTLATGFSNPEDVAIDASGNLFVTNYNGNTVQEIHYSSGTYGSPITLATGFNSPSGIAVNASGDLFVADVGSNTVKEIAYTNGTYGSPVTLITGLNSPYGVAVDTSGDLFVANHGSSTVQEISYKNGTYGSPVTLHSGFSGPTGVAVDTSGNVFVADYGNNAVKEILPQSFASTALGSTASTAVTVNFTFTAAGTIEAPAVLTQGATGLDFTDAGTGTCTTNGTTHSYSSGDICTVVVSFAPKHPGTRLGAVVLYNSSNAVIATGYVSGAGTGPVLTFSPFTQSTLTSAITNPEGMAVDGNGNIFVAAGSLVYELEYASGAYIPTYLVSSYGGTALNSTQWVTVDGAGNVFVADGGNNRILKMSPGSSGTYIASEICSNGCEGNEIAVDGSGNVYTLSAGTGAIVKETLANGSYTKSTISLSDANNPWGIIVDAAGDIFYSTQGDGCLREIPYGGSDTQIDCSLESPQGMAIDLTGNLYFSETIGDVIEYKLSGGSYTKVATPLVTGLSNSTGLWVDANDNLFVSDTGHNKVYKFDYADAPTLSFASTQVGSASSSNPQTVTVLNAGNASLTLTHPGSGSNPSFSAGFDYDSASTCDTISADYTLAAGYSCTVAVDFDPVAVGSPVTGTATLTDNSLNVTVSTQSIGLSGTATQASQTITFANPGTQTLGSPLSLSASASSGLTVSYASSTTSVCTVSSSTVTFLTSGSCTITASQAGNATYAAATSVSQTFPVNAQTTSFGSVAVNIASPPTLTVTLIFSSSVTLGSKAVLTQGASGLDFAEPSSDSGAGVCTVGSSYTSGETCTVTVSFTPRYPGVRYGAVVLSDGSGNTVATVYLSGSGTGPQVNFSPGTASTIGSGYSGPFGVAVDASGNIYVAYESQSGVKKIPYANGRYGTPIALGSGFREPTGVAVDGVGNVFVADYGNGELKEIPYANGTYGTPVSLHAFSSPTGVAVDGSGDIFVAGYGGTGVQEIPYVNGSYGTPVTLGSGFSNPTGVAVDGSENVYVADTFNNAVKEIPYSAGSYGSAVTLASGFSDPNSVAVDVNGDLYVADSSNNAIKEIPYSGGSYGTPVTLGSGFSNPTGVTLGENGNLYLADEGHSLVKELDYADAPALSFASTTVGTASASSPQTVTIHNVGNAMLTLPMPGSGANPAFTSSFAYDSGSTCNTVSANQTVAAGSSCTLQVDFDPVAAGSPVTGTATLTDNNLNLTGSTQTISLSGTGTQTSQTITFANPGTQTVATPLTLAATASSGLAVSYASSTTSVCTVSSSTVTLLGSGTCSITATQAGNTTYAAATSVSQSFPVAGTPQTITFGAPSTPVTYGVSPVTLTATASSGLAVTFSVVSGPGTITGSTLTITGAGTVVVAANQAGSTAYAAATQVTHAITVSDATPTLNWAAPSAITYGASLGGALSATATFGGSTVAGSYSYSVSTPGAASTAVTSATVLPAGSYALSVTFAPADTTDYTTANGSVTLTVVQATPTVTLASSNGTILTQNPVTFTATVSSSSGTPGGTVNFLDGSTLLGSSALVSGVATFTTSSLPIGTDTITAVYAGASNYASGTSAGLAETVQDFNVTLSTLSGSVTSVTAAPGQTAVFALVVSPVGSTVFPATVKLSASGLPPGATASFSPSSLAAGSGTTNVTLSIALPQQSAAARPNPLRGLFAPVGPIALGMCLLPFAARLRRSARTLWIAILLILGAGTLAGLTGCGSSTGFFGQPPQTYTVTVTGTSGALVHSTTVSLTIQ